MPQPRNWRERESIGPGADQFDDKIFPREIKTINARRRARGRDPVGAPDTVNAVEVVGLALSGGGIRSAAFSLGVLQALNQHDVIKQVDYLSTVSGGGYIGSALTATMTATQGDFVFGGAPSPAGKPSASDISDTDPVAHIRNYSNYLIPYGSRDVITAAAILVRGIVANLGLVLPIILFAAAITVAIYPNREALDGLKFFGFFKLPFFSSRSFAFAIVLSLLVLVGFFWWAVERSYRPINELGEFRTSAARTGGGFLAAVLIVLFLELQPVILSGMFKAAAAPTDSAVGVLGDVAKSWKEWLVALAVPFTAAVTFFNKYFAEAIKAGNSGTGWTAMMSGLTARAAVWVAGAVLPLIFWIAYLYLCYWAIPDNTTVSAELSHRPSWLNRVIDLVPVLPEWIIQGPIQSPAFLLPFPISAIVLYVLLGGGILCAASQLRPNANSLSRLYQDRLSKTFLFDPNQSADKNGITKGRDFEPLDLRLSSLKNEYAPYHLINAAINVQGSDFANRRGRNADFFLFSPRYVGSSATGYVETELYEPDPPDLDLGKAMSISGAAFSSAMGSRSIRALAPTLALLNVRLGYWLKNPKNVEGEARKKRWLGYGSGEPRGAPLYLVREMLGSLDENTPVVYVTDGGHIENLGLYELVRRRCRLIIVVDAEADPTMDFPSFIDLQRYARIDFGVRFRLPWKAVSESTLGWMGVGSLAHPEAPGEPNSGPHVMVGKIEYGGDQWGYLVYVKSSLTGDENDYIRDYARRSPKFPHEATGDQFFSEEQFEVYRALGFHALDGFLSKRAKVLVEEELLKPVPPAPAASPPPRSPPGDAASEAGTAADADSDEADDPCLVAATHPALAEIYRMLDIKDPPPVEKP